MGHFGFSYIGLLFLVLLMVPNLIWTRYKPADYSAAGENRVLAALERVGEVCTVCTALLFSDTNPHGWSAWSWWLVAACGCMALYEVWWVRYFRSKKTLADFYCSLLGVPVAGATLPVAAFFLLGIYGRVVWLMLSAVILGVGHIGIHLQHQSALKASRASAKPGQGSQHP